MTYRRRRITVWPDVLPCWLTWACWETVRTKAHGPGTDESPRSRPKAKREAAIWRPMTDLEREAATLLGRCRLPPWSATKRMAYQMSGQAELDEPQITDKQTAFLWRFCWRYRRQIPSQAVVKEAARQIKGATDATTTTHLHSDS